jgi:NADPH:quinone reductase-like Zn-dependent oxidoreductase
METAVKAIVQDVYGSAEVLELREVDTPLPKDNEVLVRVFAAGAGPDVWHLMTGTPYMMRVMGFGLRRPKVRVRGWDVAGRVEAVGREVTTLRPGDEVYGICDGSFAEYACVRVDKGTHKPRRLSFEEAAAVPISGVTALQALRDRGRVSAGQRVLIIGAAGGVGTFAVQLAKVFGAEVTGVCSTTKVELVASLGADHVIDYRGEDFAAGGRRYDVVVDTAGKNHLSRLRRVLAPGGRLVLVGSEEGGRWIGDMDRLLRAAAVSPLTRQRLGGLLARVREKDLRYLGELIDAGQVTPVIDRTFPLDQAPDAVRYVAKEHTRGKVVVTVGEPR